MLTLCNVKKKFGRNEVLKSINLELDKKTYGLLGPNGAGKTTLLRCITTIYPVNGGEIRFNGSDVYKDKSYHSNIGYLPQKFGMYKELTSLEMMSMLGNLKGIPQDEIKTEAERCIELVGLEDKMNKKVRTLSGGMVRRLGVAQALMGNPELIFFDEPTAGLDPEERMRFKNIVAHLKGEHTVIISTHIVEDVENLCSEIIVMNNGEIATQGSCGDIQKLADGKVYEIKSDDIKKLKEPYYIQREFERDGASRTVVLSPTPQTDAVSVSPSVEDGYICIMKKL